MAAPTWLTKAGLLGTVTERTAVTIPFAASGSDTTFTLLSGTLPNGLVLKVLTTATSTATTGYITGNPMSVPTKISSEFVIRARNDVGISDRTFVLDTIGTTAPIWVTTAGYLPIGTSGECFGVNRHTVDYQLYALPNILFENMKMRYYIADGDGQIPRGLRLTEDGRIIGTIDEITVSEEYGAASSAGYDTEFYDRYPYDSAVIIGDISTRPKLLKKIYQFYITATDGYEISRKQFKIQVLDHNSLRGDTSYISSDAECFQAGDSYLFTPTWLSPANLGIRRANNYQIIDLKTYDPHPAIGTNEWTWDTLTVNPEIRVEADTQANTGPDGFEVVMRGVVDTYAYLPAAIQGDLYRVSDENTNYVFDGTDWISADFYPKYNRAGTSTVHIKNLTSLPQVGHQFRLDNYLESALNTTTYTISSVTGTTTSCQIGIRYNDRLVDDVLIYDTILLDNISDGTVFYIGTASEKPLGFNLNPETGDLYGQIPYIPAYNLDYKFTIRMIKNDVKTGDTSYLDRVFQLRLQGSINTDLGWISTATIGTIRAGLQSELFVKAEHENFPDLDIQYKLTSGELPNGLEFKNDGSIAGKIPYGGLTDVDAGNFTIDSDNTKIDRAFTFTAEATNAYRLATIDQTFTILIDDNDRTPYSSVYIRPFMNRDRRKSYRNFINSTNIFNEDVLYRPADPAFGLQKEIRMTIEYGLERLNLAEYIIGLQYYFYNKRFYFGAVKTLPAEDEKGNYVYDIVYLDVIDNQINSAGKSPDSISFLINSQLVDLYSDSTVNWRNSLESIPIYGDVIKTDEYLRPRFMRTVQSITGAPLGFIKAVPIAYIKPGEGKNIVRKIQLSGFDFKLMDFEVDRLLIDQTFDYDGDKYLKFPIKNIDDPQTLNVLAGPDGIIILDEDGNELLVE